MGWAMIDAKEGGDQSTESWRSIGDSEVSHRPSLTNDPAAMRHEETQSAQVSQKKSDKYDLISVDWQLRSVRSSDFDGTWADSEVRSHAPTWHRTMLGYAVLCGSCGQSARVIMMAHGRTSPHLAGRACCFFFCTKLRFQNWHVRADAASVA